MVDLAALVLLIRALPVLGGLALALGGCTGVIFQPMHQLVLTPDQIGLDYEEVEFEAADGVPLHGWFLPAQAPRRGSILFLHGNAQNISTHIASVAWLPAQGFDVLLFDYRGYGESEGSPSLAGLHLDFEAALQALLARPEIERDRVIVFGQSLGGSLAITALAASPLRHQVRALIVEGAFTSYRALAREKLADFWLTWPVAGAARPDHRRPLPADRRDRRAGAAAAFDRARRGGPGGAAGARCRAVRGGAPAQDALAGPGRRAHCGVHDVGESRRARGVPDPNSRQA